MRWTVPVELAIACAPDTQRALICARRGRGDRPRADAVMFSREGWLWAQVDFHGPGRLGLVFRSDVPVWENATPRLDAVVRAGAAPVSEASR